MSEEFFSTKSLGKTKLFQGKKPLLSFLTMELTERCNNNCVHCFINHPSGDREAQSRELTTGEIQDILLEAVSLGCFLVRFTGGEPLLRKDFGELYLFARRLGLKVLIFTNATLVTRDLAKLLARVPPLEPMEITVYGMKKESYEAVSRLPGSYEAFKRGVSLLLEYKIPFVVKAALLPSNKDEMKEFEAWAATIPAMNKHPSYAMTFDLRGRRDSDEKNELIRGLRLSPEEELKVLTRDRKNYVKEMKAFMAKFASLPGEQLLRCGAGKGSGNVDAYGILQPCLLLRHPETNYDLRKGSLKDAFTNFFPKMRMLAAKNPNYLKRCARCFLKTLCEQCPSKSWAEHGTLDTPVEYSCDITHAHARYLGLLEEGEKAWEVTDYKERLRKLEKEGEP